MVTTSGDARPYLRRPTAARVYSRNGRRLTAEDADGGSVPARLRRVVRGQVQLPRRPCSPGQPESTQAGALHCHHRPRRPALAAVTLAAVTLAAANLAAATLATPPRPMPHPTSRCRHPSISSAAPLVTASVRTTLAADRHPLTYPHVHPSAHRPTLCCVQKMGVITFGSHDFAVEQQGRKTPLGIPAARLLRLLGAPLSALGSSALPGRGRPTTPGARASRLQKPPISSPVTLCDPVGGAAGQQPLLLR